MVKTSSKKQRGLAKTRKHAIRVPTNDDSVKTSSTISKLIKKVRPLAEGHWNFLLRTCSMWTFTPVTTDPGTGRTKLSPIWKRCIHYTLLTVYGLILSYRFVVTIQRFAQGQMDLLTYICACSFVVLFIAAASTLGTTWSAQAICDLFNSWKSTENFMSTHMGRRMTGFDEKATCVKVLLLAIIIHLAAVNASMFSLIGDVPTSVITTLTRTGLFELPEFLPPIVWSLVFLPFELLTLWPPMLMTGIGGGSLAVGLGTLKVFTDEARKVQVKNMDDWMRLYRLRRIIQVDGVIAEKWASNVATALLVCASCGVILLLYVTVRPSDLPFLVYIWFPVVAILLMVVITWLAYDCVFVKRGVQDIDGSLESGLNRWRFRDMEMRRNTVQSRMLKSFRPVVFSLAPFTDEITLDVPVNVWDEVMNQLLFLLSL